MRAAVRLGFTLVLGVTVSALAQRPDSARVTPQSASTELALGKRAFDINCARCHGIGATGNTGPSLARADLPRASSDSAFRDVIRSGIEGTEMPGSYWITDADITRIIAYVRSLGLVGDARIVGNAARGQAIYARSGCARCHVVDGIGGINGPELTNIGTRRSALYLHRAVVDPSADFPTDRGYQLYGVVRVVEADGQTVTGIRMNEDTYTIQLRDSKGRFYSLRKDQLRSLERQFGRSQMPSVRGTLTDAQIDDLVAYLASLRAAR